MLSRVIFIFIMMLPLSCQTKDYFQTLEPTIVPDALKENLLADIGSTLPRDFPPAQTRIYFPHKGEALASSMEKALRQKGYAVSAASDAQKSGDIHLGLKLNAMAGDIFLMRLVVGEEYQISRVYQKNKNGAYTASGPILMRRM